MEPVAFGDWTQERSPIAIVTVARRQEHAMTEIFKAKVLVVDGNLITSRKPADIPAFNDALIRAIEAA